MLSELEPQSGTLDDFFPSGRMKHNGDSRVMTNHAYVHSLRRRPRHAVASSKMPYQKSASKRSQRPSLPNTHKNYTLK